MINHDIDPGTAVRSNNPLATDDALWNLLRAQQDAYQISLDVDEADLSDRAAFRAAAIEQANNWILLALRERRAHQSE